MIIKNVVFFFFFFSPEKSMNSNLCFCVVFDCIGDLFIDYIFKLGVIYLYWF